MKIKHIDTPAFPSNASENDNVYESGMTLLDHFAGLALHGIYASDSLRAEDKSNDWTKEAYNIAEAMLAERERRMNDQTT